MDLGVNQGEFSSEIADRVGSRIYGAEPDPVFFQALPDIAGLKALQVAIGATDGSVEFHLNATMCSSALFKETSNRGGGTVKVPSMTFPSFLRLHELARVQLVKIDIEGAEVGLFDSTPDEILLDIEQLAIEFHEFMDERLAPDVRRIRERLRKLGFYDIDFSRSQTDVLFINQAIHPLDFHQK